MDRRARDADPRRLTDIVIKPNDCAFEEPLDLEVEFDAKRPLRDATWKIGYVVDTINQTRHVVDLGTTTETDYEGKSCFFRFRVESIPVGDVEPSALANCATAARTRWADIVALAPLGARSRRRKRVAAAPRGAARSVQGADSSELDRGDRSRRHREGAGRGDAAAATWISRGDGS